MTQPRSDLARDLTVAVIHFRTPGVLATCLEHIAEAAPRARIIVVDVAPVYGASGAQAADAHGAERLDVPNHSYAHAVNTALHACKTPFLAFLNADAYVRPETFANLLFACRAPDVAAAGPLVRDAEGRLQNQGLPYRVHQRRVLGGAVWTEVPWLSACVQVVRMAAVRDDGAAAAEDDDRPNGPRPVGGMDATFRFYNEDLEWGWRLREGGWRLRLVATPATHLGGNATPPQRDAFVVEGLRGGFVLSRRYRPAWLQAVHRSLVMLWAALQERLGPAEQRRRHRAIRRMFATGEFDMSPFGETLAEENPLFWNQVWNRVE